MGRFFYYAGNVLLVGAMIFVTFAPFYSSNFGLRNNFELYKFVAFILFVLSAGCYSMSLEFFKKQVAWIGGAAVFYFIFQFIISLSSGSSLFKLLPMAFSSNAFALLY